MDFSVASSDLITNLGSFQKEVCTLLKPPVQTALTAPKRSRLIVPKKLQTHSHPRWCCRLRVNSVGQGCLGLWTSPQACGRRLFQRQTLNLVQSAQYAERKANSSCVVRSCALKPCAQVPLLETITACTKLGNPRDKCVQMLGVQHGFVNTYSHNTCIWTHAHGHTDTHTHPW